MDSDQQDEEQLREWIEARILTESGDASTSPDELIESIDAADALFRLVETAWPKDESKSADDEPQEHDSIPIPKSLGRFQIKRSTDPGEIEFQRKCSVCHTLEPDDKNRAGQTLYNLFGREAGTLEGYKYSKALIASKLIWNEETIGRLFDEGPDIVTPGSKMPIQRLKSVDRRDALIKFLKKATAPQTQEKKLNHFNRDEK